MVKKKTKRIQCRLSEERHERVVSCAIARDITITRLIEELIDNYLPHGKPLPLAQAKEKKVQ